MYRLILTVVLMSATLVCGESFSTPPTGGWPAKPPTGSRMADLAQAGNPRAQFILAIPESYDPGQEWPVWIVLHGGPNGGRPETMASLFRGGLLARKAIAIFPRSLDDRLLEWNYPESGMYLLRILVQVSREYRIDPRRLYLAGHSMGGGGTWCMGAVLGDVWAGIGPMSGWYQATPLPNPQWLRGVPIWSVHGDDDQAVPAAMSRQAMAAVQKQGQKLQVVTEPPTPESMAALRDLDAVFRFMPGVGHDIFAPFPKRGAIEIGAQVAWLSAKRRASAANIEAATARLAQWGKPFGWSPAGGPLGSYPGEKPAAR